MLRNVFIWFLDQKITGLDPQIMILHEIISEIVEISDFIFKKWPKWVESPILPH